VLGRGRRWKRKWRKEVKKKNFTTEAANAVVMVATKAWGTSRKKMKPPHFLKISTFGLFVIFLISVVQGRKQ
jgi:hypothetical protein